MAAVMVLAAYITRPREPVYEGKRLSEWLKGLETTPWFPDYPNVVDPEQKKVKEAIQAIGTNALPYLMTAATSEDSKGSLMVMKAVASLPLMDNTTKSHHIGRISVTRKRHAAILALGLLAERAAPSLDMLRGLVLTNSGACMPAAQDGKGFLKTSNGA